MEASFDNGNLLRRVKLAMKAAGLDGKKLASAAGLQYRTLQVNLAGKHILSLESLARIAAALEVSTDWLLTGQPAALDPVTLRRAMMRVLGFVENARGLGGVGPSSYQLASEFYLSYIDYYVERFGEDWDEEQLRLMADEFTSRIVSQARALP